MITVFAIVLNFNGKENTNECLKTAKNLKVNNGQLRIVVIDNGSEEKLKIDDEMTVVIRNEENLGYAGGNNVGVRYALENGADYVVILNNDTLIHEDLINELLAVARFNSGIGIVSPKIYFAKGYEYHKDRYAESERGKVLWYAGGVMDWGNVLGSHRGVNEVDKGQYDRMDRTDFASGCCLLIKREVLETVGMFDEKYFLYYEDSDLAERAKRKNYSIMYAPKAYLWHKNAGSAGGSGSALQDYYITRNRLLFGMRYASIRTRIALLKESMRLLVTGRAWQKKGVRDFYLRRFGKGSYRE